MDYMTRHDVRTSKENVTQRNFINNAIDGIY